MRLRTFIIIIVVLLAAGVGLTWMFLSLEEQARMHTEAQQGRLAMAQMKAAERDSLLRLDSLKRYLVTPDLQIHQLRGMVRSVQTDSTLIEFDREGRWTNASRYILPFTGQTAEYERDKMGRICRGYSGGKHIQFLWDDRRLKHIYVGRDSDSLAMRIRIDYDHHERPAYVRVIKPGRSDATMTYTYPEADSHGNWTRCVVRTAILGDTLGLSREQTRTRIIKYY